MLRRSARVAAVVLVASADVPREAAHAIRASAFRAEPAASAGSARRFVQLLALLRRQLLELVHVLACLAALRPASSTASVRCAGAFLALLRRQGDPVLGALEHVRLLARRHAVPALLQRRQHSESWTTGVEAALEADRRTGAVPHMLFPTRALEVSGEDLHVVFELQQLCGCSRTPRGPLPDRQNRGGPRRRRTD